jgi:xylan 1,4-beta-xylosidase
MTCRLLLLATAAATLAPSQPRTATVRVDFGQKSGTLDTSRIALGQGGLSADLMWASRAAEIRALNPKLIRIFVGEYYDLLPARGRYNFEKLDPNVDLILQTGAKPLMTICFKPRLLYPVNHDVVEPNDWTEWDDLVYNVVKHYKDRGAGIRYWEIANEPTAMCGITSTRPQPSCAPIPTRA